MEYKYTNIIPLLSLLLFFHCSNAQISDTKKIPFSTKDHWSIDDVPTVFSGIMTEEEQYNNGEQKYGGYRVAALKSTHLTLNNCGKWTTTVNGDFVWRAKINVENALALGLYFNRFELVEGATFHIYDPLKKQVLGAYTNKNTKESRRFAIEPIQGNVVILEYFEPANVKGFSTIEVENIATYFRGVHDIYAKTSDPCEVDVNCSEGASWTDQRDAVVKLTITTGSGIFFCSGALINNTNQDCIPYILSAFHCIDDGGSALAQQYLDQLVVQFNYQKSECAGGSANSQSIVGVDLVAHSDDHNISGSDFSLLELSEQVPASYAPFFAGWDVTGDAAESGVSIHHPSGDVKKISTYTSTLQSASYGFSGPQCHWKVNWVATDNGHGVTEGGSSGSPIFNQNGLIVGQLSGGGSFCSSPNDPDYYGKMSYNWESNNTPSNLFLKPYLDPNSSGASQMNGTRYWCLNTIEESTLKNNIDVYPNPVVNRLSISLPGEDVNSVEIISVTGKVVFQNKNLSNNKISIDAQNWASGTYIVRVLTDKEVMSTKFVKQ